MNGKLIDVVLLVAWGAIFFAVAVIHPGIANFLIALIGALVMGAYNTFVRHDPRTDALRRPWRS
jgi:hypothetical protein